MRTTVEVLLDIKDALRRNERKEEGYSNHGTLLVIDKIILEHQKEVWRESHSSSSS